MNKGKEYDCSWPNKKTANKKSSKKEAEKFRFQLTNLNSFSILINALQQLNKIMEKYSSG